METLRAYGSFAFFLHVVYEQSAKGILVKWCEKYDWLQLSVSRILLA